MDSKVRLGNIAKLFYGKMPNKSQLGSGDYDAFSGYKNVGKYPIANTLPNTLIVVARGVGGTGDVKYLNDSVFLTNLSIAVEIKDRLVSRYIYWKYYLSGFNHLRSGSAQPQITIADLSNEMVVIPSRDEMERRIKLLDAIEDKIALNNRINDYLAA